MLRGKKILLGVCGSIAAYKAAFLIRLLVKEGAEVKALMTDAAAEFITPLTLSTLSGNPVARDFFDPSTGEWESHVKLGLWADAMLIAPATAKTIADLAMGSCPNLLAAAYLSARCPVFVAPAMDLDMYRHPAVQENLDKLKKHGVKIIDAAYGELASGLIGQGRMAEPEELMEALTRFFETTAPLGGKKALVTAGPTFESIDPVRYIGNHSSGKMGYAIALQLAENGAEVDLVSGPVSLTIDHPNVSLTKVQSAEEMYEVCRKIYPGTDIAVFAAAVADYAPEKSYTQKLKKGIEGLRIDLKKNPDIAFELGKMKERRQLNVGFALETENEVDNAIAKLQTKNFDLIVLNSLNDPGAGFSHDTNKIRIIHTDNKIEEFELKKKEEVAGDIVRAIITKVV